MEEILNAERLLTPSKRHAALFQLDDPSAESSRQSPGSEKRRRVTLDDGSPRPSQVSSRTSEGGHEASTSRITIPDHVLLYHLAQSAHQASRRHLQQAFVPSWVSCKLDDAHHPISMIREAGSTGPFMHDTGAADKSLALLLHALDLLRLGLKQKDLSDRDRVLFGLEHAIVGVKVLAACQASIKQRKGKDAAGLLHKVDCKKLAEDLRSYIGQSVQPLTSSLETRLIIRYL